jgi:feruloyl-CoA synthase
METAETLTPIAAPMRDPRYAPRALEVERRADGTIVLVNPRPIAGVFPTTLSPLEHWADKAPARVWLAERSGEGWRRVSYSAALEEVRAIAGALEGLGLEAGAPVLILARNGVDTALFTYAVMSLGRPAAAVSPQYGLAGADASRLAYAVRLLRPCALFVDDAAAFETVLGAPFLAGVPVIAAANARPGDLALDELRRAAPLASRAGPDDIARLLLTSGSTGDPKAVMCLHRNMANNSAQLSACYDDPDPPVLVSHAPWSHAMGAVSILHYSLHRGGTLYIDAGQPAQGRFGETVRNLKEISPSYHNMVPAGWTLLADALEADEALARRFFADLRVMQYGGAGLGPSVGARIQAAAVRTMGAKITFGTAYGATEVGPAATTVHWPNERMGLVGLPIPGTQVKLAPVGEKLEARVRGPQVTPGYYRAPEATSAAFDEEGFFRLGDAVRPVDPSRLELGLAFDGRLSENFKLATGAFVNAGALRLAALSAVGGAACDAIVCGEGQASVGLLFFRNLGFEEQQGEAALAAQVREGLERLNLEAKGVGGRIARALILKDQPDPATGEITDKGYINQAKARSRRIGEVERLFAGAPDPDVLVL